MKITLGGYIRYSDLKKQKQIPEHGWTVIGRTPGNQGNPGKKPVSQQNVLTNLPAVKLSISNEGAESWRELVRKQQPEHAEEDWILMYEGMTSYSTLLYGETTVSFHNIHNKGKGTLNDEAADLVQAYGKLYDEIVRGYETGEREVYAEDPEAEDGLRRLTLNEELAGLDEAFEKAVDSLESMHAALQRNWSFKIDYRGMEIRNATGRERELLLREKAEYEYRIERLARENTLPENTKEKLMEAVQEFVARYTEGNGGNIARIVNHIQALSVFRR